MKKLLITFAAILIFSSCTKSVCKCTVEYTFNDHPELNTTSTFSTKVSKGDACEEITADIDTYNGSIRTSCVRVRK